VTDVLPSTIVSLADHTTRATIRGVGPPMLLVHAIGLDRRMWDEVAAELAGGATVITYDVRGHGSASAAPTPDSIAELADDAATVLELLGLGPARVVGLSLGGAIAQELALRNPHLVTGLTLCATLCQGHPVARERAALAEREGMASQIEPTLERWFAPASRALRPEAVMYAHERLSAMGVAAWAATWRALADLDTRARLGQISVPTRVIVGELDPSTPISVAQTISDLIPGATLEVLPDASHMLSLESPVELATGIARAQA
jgi:3-oxoadipate enol-lactonase